MNSKEVITEKKFKKDKSKNGGQQIFVLPPNLLQKLGIRLENMGDNPDSTDGGHKMSTCVLDATHEHSLLNTKHELNSDNIINNEAPVSDASIVKTAKLMRDSVFLSPTFNTANNVTSSQIAGDLDICIPENNYTPEICKEAIDKSLKPSNILLETDIPNNKKLSNKQDDDVKDLGLTIGNNNLQMNGSLRTLEKPVMQHETKKVINIISEETVNIEKLNDLKILQKPSKAAMIPASLNTIIVKNIKKNSIPQSQTIPTFPKDMQSNEPNNKVANNEIRMDMFPKTDNSEYENLKFNNGSKNFFDSENNENFIVNLNACERAPANSDVNDKVAQVVGSQQMEFSKIFENEKKQLRNISIDNNEQKQVVKKSIGDNVESKLDFDQKPHNADIIENVKEIKSIDGNLDEDIKCSITKNIYYQDPLSKRQIDGTSENMESFLPEVINTNNNNWLYNKSDDDAEQKKSLSNVHDILETESDFVDTPIDQDVINHSENFTTDKSEIREKNVVTVQESVCLLEAVDNDTTTIIKDVKSLTNQHFSGPNDEDISKLSLPLSAERNNLISKLCIQGVEKPGGTKKYAQVIKPLKTYSNTKENKIRDKFFPPEKTVFNLQFDHGCNIDLKEIATIEIPAFKHFCKCSDFGALDHGRYENSYEHIHFTQRRSLDCNPHVIFGIYDDHQIIDIEEGREELDLKEMTKEYIDLQGCTEQRETTDSHHSICWYNADTLRDKLDIDHDNFRKQEKFFHEHSQAVDQTIEENLLTQSHSNNNIRSPKQRINEALENLEVNYQVNDICDAVNINMEITTEIGEKILIKDDSNDSEKLQSISRKRKMSNNSDEELDNKKTKNLLDHNIEGKVTEPQIQDKVATADLKGSTAGDDIVKEKFQNGESEGQKVTCALCGDKVVNAEWIRHIASSHDYIAWKEGEPSVNLKDEDDIRNHLNHVVQELGQLRCARCGLARKYAKSFLHHIKTCYNSSDINNDREPPSHLSKILEAVSDITCEYCGFKCKNTKEHAAHVRRCTRKSEQHTRSSSGNADNDVSEEVTCAVCKENVPAQQWTSHIQRQHNYKAWREGDPPLNVQDEESVRKHLYGILQDNGPLICSKCGKSRKYVKLFLQHIESCTEVKEHEEPVDAFFEELNDILETSLDDNDIQGTNVIKCGVCQLEMQPKQWIDHIQKKHNYLSWQDGKASLDICDDEAVRRYLYVLVQKLGALVCAKCGVARRYVKNYLSHMENCTGPSSVGDEDGNSTFNDTTSDMDATLGSSRADDENDTRPVQCAVCSEELQARRWIDHIRTKHNYLAWQDGQTPLDLEDKDAIRSHLKHIISKIGGLTCAKCGLRRRKALMFYNHIKICDGTAKSLDTKTPTPQPETARCAVCRAEVAGALWVEHIAKEHSYLAWREGDEPLKVDDESSVKDHLYKISQIAGELICSKCGMVRKYVKSYLQHTRGCVGSEVATDDTLKASETKTDQTKVVTCALCRHEMDDSSWMEHIAKEHNYISWKQDDTPLVFDDESSLRDYLYNIVQSIGSLACSKCGLVRKYAKSYLMHIEACQKVTWYSINKMIAKMKKEKGDMVRCAVCAAEVDDTEWVQHIAGEHNYLAWRDRDPAINLDDEDEVRNHLKRIIQEEGYLKCPKCNLNRKYAKLYLQHVNACDGSTEENVEMDDSMNNAELPFDDSEADDPTGSAVIKCGVCAREVARAAWRAHIQKEHKYLAWEEGKEPIDVNDKEAVYNHLYAVNVKYKGLTCGSCGALRKHVKAYLHHAQYCSQRNYDNSNEIVECGVCGDRMAGKLWRDHAMQSHYNIAWVAGDTPIDLRNFFSVDKYLKEYHEHHHKLVCNICGLSRASLAGFYAHILVCGKTDEEVDTWKDLCDICNQKYLCIYKTQHYWAHRVQEMTKERKNQEKLKKEEYLNDDVNYTPGRRRAAEKARSVIGVYAAKTADDKCKYCSFEADNKDDLAKHTCAKSDNRSNGDSDDSTSIKLEDYSEEESEDTEVDSDVSNEDQESFVSEGNKSRSKNESTGAKQPKKGSKFPFVVKDINRYIQQSKQDHFELFNMREILFPHWRGCTYEVVCDELKTQYLPQLEESCKVTISNGGWSTYKRFESKREKGCTVLFTGGSIQCIAWAPERPDSTPACSSLLAVSTHRGADSPRLLCTDTPSHPALIQIWNFHNFKSEPKLAFGLAHDYGTVWSMDWCPSGARDISDRFAPDDNVTLRLGLLAVACSNGSAYVVSVPYPDKTNTSDIILYKMKPCVELRMTRGNNNYQATSINWSLFKGYTTISVGYGDGTVALYDLVTESPLLTAKEGDFNILYPFQDERVHNSCVTGLTSCVLGAWCSSSVTGSTAGVAGVEARAGRGARPVRAHSALAASAATFMPHWPNVMLSGDDTIMGLSPSELEWGYVGRRVGSVRALAPCVHRARIAAVVPPLLQVMRPHPVAFKGHKTIQKKNVAMLEMTPLARKRSKQSNDELSMKVEPVTYEEAVASYGIEFKFERNFDKTSTQRTHQKHRVPFPERFPLADVPALAYCRAAAHYTKLAVATHCGLIFLLDV